MKQSTKKLLEDIRDFSKAAAKLSLDSGPDRPYDPNFGIVNVPQQSFSPIYDHDNFQGSKLTQREDKSGVFPTNQARGQSYPDLIAKMTLRIISDIKKFCDQIILWAKDKRNPYKDRSVQYREALSHMKSLIYVIEDINADAHLAVEDKLNPESTKKQIHNLQLFMSYFSEFGGLFSSIKMFETVYGGCHILLNMMNNAIGAVSAPNQSTFDMFAEQDAEEDAEEKKITAPVSSNDETQVIPVLEKEVVNADPSLSFEIKPLKYNKI